MATIALKDYRRTDLRKQTLENPCWITSAPFGPEADDLGALLFSFPTKPVPDNLNPYSTYAPAGDLGLPGKYYLIESAAVEIMTPFAGGTVTLDVGLGTIATDAAVDGNNITYSAADGIIGNALVTEGTIGMYLPKFDGSAAAIYHYLGLVVCADTSTPCVFASLASNAAITAGKARVHLKISRLGDVPRS